MNDIVSDYLNGIKCVDICRKYGVKYNNLLVYFKDYRIFPRVGTNEKAIRYMNAINYYEKHDISVSKVSKMFDISRGKLAMKISSCGIPIINKQNEPKFNYEYFDCIDTEEKAYWLGFIFADGYIASKKSNSKDDYSFELSLAIKDILHLEKFATATGMKSKDYGHMCRLSVKNKHMWNVLNNYGCTPRKSLTLKFPDRSIFKDKSLIRHFIRGYFDGDGCISYANKEHTRPSILLLGTIEFLSDVLIEFGVDRKIHQHHKTKTFEFRFGDIKNCMKFMKYLYADSSVYLDRKKKRFEYFAALRSNP